MFSEKEVRRRRERFINRNDYRSFVNIKQSIKAITRQNITFIIEFYQYFHLQNPHETYIITKAKRRICRMCLKFISPYIYSHEYRFIIVSSQVLRAATQRCGAEEAHGAHNPGVTRSKLVIATVNILFFGFSFFLLVCFSGFISWVDLFYTFLIEFDV